ncbi:MAG: hybrid cluster protein [Methanomassiliicoccales archaeon PtaU1.Bin124]|nr:MAG: hybrid cluster protein [Methanomassiliicoccales archaeon PtaU1.Bin124]
MYCNQCQQTAKGIACTTRGVCGKDEDVSSLQETLLYGLKGIAAYAYHARELGKTDEEVSAFIEEALFKTLTNVDFSTQDLWNTLLKAGMINLKTMQMLDAGNTEHFGLPSPTKVKTGKVRGPGILVTGHDLLDLEALLKQTEGRGINVYTHGEMLPANAYPKLNKYKHLIGNYGGAWQKQKKEFDEFKGPILVTTNCIMIPPESYKDRIFTTSVVAAPGAKHIADRNDFSEIIKLAEKIGDIGEKGGPDVLTGAHHKAVLSLAPKVIEAVKAGKIKHIFLIGGCDGATPGRDYYTTLAESVPKDCLILTLACGKYRFNEKDFGDIDGIPRLLDMGQCNDAYSAIIVAVELAKAFNVEVNQLPLSIVLSWFEQKAVAIVLTLLALGIKNVKVGPTLPAFITPNNWKVIQDNYGWKAVGEPAVDLKEMLGQ